MYLAPYPGPGGRFQVSSEGGSFPRWRADGREILFLASDARLMAVDVATHERSVDIGVARQLVRILVSPVGGGYGYDVSPDGKRILVLSDGRVGAQQPLTLVQNWPSTLP